MGVALVTPFKEDESVDYDALMRIVDYLIQNNADFCIINRCLLQRYGIRLSKWHILYILRHRGMNGIFRTLQRIK